VAELTPLLRAGTYFGRETARLSTAALSLTESLYAGRQELPLHSHQNAHFCFVLRGTYTEWIDARPVERRAHDFVFYPAGIPHAEQHHETNRHFLIDVTPQLAASVAAVGIALDAPFELRGALPRTIAARLHREFGVRDAFTPLSAEALVVDLLAQSARERSAPPRAMPWLARVEELLRSRFDETLSLREIAAVAGVHPVHVSRTFRRAYGCSIGEFVRRARIAAAQRELARGRASIAEIAGRCGFADQSHFHRTFKRVTGMTPRQYRVAAR
jgi:AraC family transcriptional regulator